MTEEQYNADLKAIEDDNKTRLLNLYRRFAIEATEIKVGDIIHDESCNFYMLVDKVGVMQPKRFQNLPFCTFYGPRLKKDLTPTKISSREYSDTSRCKLIKKKST